MKKFLFIVVFIISTATYAQTPLFTATNTWSDSCGISAKFKISTTETAVIWDSVLTNLKQEAGDTTFVNGYVPNSNMWLQFACHTKASQDSSTIQVNFYKNGSVYSSHTYHEHKATDSYPVFQSLIPIIGNDSLKVTMKLISQSTSGPVDTCYTGYLTLLRLP